MESSTSIVVQHIQTLREKCPYSELFWFAFSRIWTEFGEILSLRIQSKCGKMRNRITVRTNNFYFVNVLQQNPCMAKDVITFRLVCNWQFFLFISLISFIHFINLMDYLTSIFTITNTNLNQQEIIYLSQKMNSLQDW